jgi:hypothetical protein
VQVHGIARQVHVDDIVSFDITGARTHHSIRAPL